MTQGIIKRQALEYDTRKDRIIALTLDDDDELIGVKLTSVMMILFWQQKRSGNQIL